MKKLLSLLILVSFTIKAQEIKIGTQTWTTKNLDVSKFRNGEAIPFAKTDAVWELAAKKKQPAYCYCQNKAANGIKYGKLYNWYAVNDSRGLAPKGFHIPTDAEWTMLTDYLGGDSIAGKKMKSSTGWGWQNIAHVKEMKSRIGFKPDPGYANVGTNASGFAGRPGGNRGSNTIGDFGFWWSSSEGVDEEMPAEVVTSDEVEMSHPRNAWSRRLEYNDADVDRYVYSKVSGLSVRCIKD